MLSPSHLIFMLQVKIKFRLNFNFDLQNTLPPLPPHKNFLLDEFSVHTVNYRPSFLLSIFGPSAKRGTINLWKKMRIHNLQSVWLEKMRLIRCLLYGFLFGRTGNKCRSSNLTDRGHKKKGFYWFTKTIAHHI